jgi:hypothetical protein
MPGIRPRRLLRPALLAAAGLAAPSVPADSPDSAPSFLNDVVPILTKASCNTGACHAKAGTGQRGFELSLLGFEPLEDYEHLVKEGRGRRVFPAAPEQSLLLLKAANAVPHGGGRKLDPASDSYRTLARWIAAGMPYDTESAPRLASIHVDPPAAVLEPGKELALRVTARYSDGSSRDVTAMALYEPNDRNLAETTDTGRVRARELPGKAGVMVRYAGQIAVLPLTIPLGAPVAEVPPVRNFVDEHVFANLRSLGIPPSGVCDDATFLRRVTLDLAGRLPTVEETEAFLDDPAAPEVKRPRAVDALLAGPDYPDFFANKWTALLKNKRDEAADITANFAFHAWMRDQFLANTPYDQITRDILAATGTIVANPPVAWYKRVKEPNAQLEDVAQLFLGVRMQCAQCHHHPFERWSQHDYYSMAAFFSQVGRRPTAIAGEDVIFHRRGIAQTENRKTKAPVRPAALGSPTLDLSPDDDPRLHLADWMAQPSNPFFAKALVNRYWKHFFKRGLVEPEDDLRDTNPPSNPELLDALAREFVASGFDLKALARTLTTSTAYQLDASPNAHNAVDLQNFSRFYPKRMQAEVLLDALDHLTGARTEFPDLPPGTRAIALPDNSYNRSSLFLKVFGRPESQSVCECERVQSSSLAQSLHLMNSAEVKAKLSFPGGRAETLAKSGLPEPEIIRQVYLAAYSREPDPEEAALASSHFAAPRSDAAGTPLPADRALRLAIEDLLWALLNTKEFLFNH